MMKTRIEKREDGGHLVVELITGRSLYACWALEEAQRWSQQYEQNHVDRKTKVRQDGERWSVIHIATNTVLSHYASRAEAESAERMYDPPTALSGPGKHFFVDGDKIVEAKSDEMAYHVGPYFGDPQRKEIGEGTIYTLGGDEPKKPWAGESPSLDKETIKRLKQHMSKLESRLNPMSPGVQLDDFLRTVPMREMINAIFWQMAKAENYPGVFSPNDDQYNDIMNYIFDNYVDLQNGNKHPQSQSPGNRKIDPQVVASSMTKLIDRLLLLEGLKPPKILYEDYPNKASLLIVIDPEFEFEDDDHMQRWEQKLAATLRGNKPQGLKTLEVIFNRTEVL